MAVTVLIAGASRGIGLEIARRYVKAGAHVIATVRDLDKAEDLRKIGVEMLTLDVTSESSASKLAHALGDRPIHLLVCNAGVMIGRGGIHDPEYTEETFRSTLMTNVFGPFNVIRACLPALRRGAKDEMGGRVAVISSILGSSTAVSGACYSYNASKAGATNLSKNLAVELKKEGIAVSAFHPGWVMTDMGGPNAAVTAEDSAKGLVDRFEEMSLAASGSVLSFRGEEIAP